MILYAPPHSSYETKIAIVNAFKGGETAFELRELSVRNFDRQMSERKRDLAMVEEVCAHPGAAWSLSLYRSWPANH